MTNTRINPDDLLTVAQVAGDGAGTVTQYGRQDPDHVLAVLASFGSVTGPAMAEGLAGHYRTHAQRGERLSTGLTDTSDAAARGQIAFLSAEHSNATNLSM